LDIKKIGGPSAPDPQQDTEPSGPDRKGVQAPFDAASREAGSATEGLEALDAAVTDTGEIQPEQALEAVMEAARATIVEALPDEVDSEQVLEYIRETLEDDPTFSALIRGT
jgi:hypothetical protein